MSTPDEDWTEFVRAHGQVTGYDRGGVLMPVPPGDPRAIRIVEETAAAFGRDPGTPVYGPRAGA